MDLWTESYELWYVVVVGRNGMLVIEHNIESNFLKVVHQRRMHTGRQFIN